MSEDNIEDTQLNTDSSTNQGDLASNKKKVGFQKGVVHQTTSPGRPKGSPSLLGLIKKELDSIVDTGKGEKKTVAKVLIHKFIQKALDEEKTFSAMKEILDRVEGRSRETTALEVTGKLPFDVIIQKATAEEIIDRVKRDAKADAKRNR